MAQQTVSIKLALPPKPGFPGRPSVVQVLQARPGPCGQTIIQQRSPGFKQITAIRPFPQTAALPINTNTAVQYQRKPAEMTIINPAAPFVSAAPTVAFGAFASQPISLAPGGLQTLLGTGPPGSSTLASSRKPCNCTKSHCLKLYCECFAQGQLCQNCNCNNCMNNLAYEEERGRAIKMTLERNPTAFHPKIGRGEGERKHTKGCNCKRSGCLKNYCECYEAKISCSDLCRCQGCRNTEDSIERRSLMRLAAMGSLKSRQPASYKKHLVKPPPETLPHVFLTWEVIEATISCLLAQADDAERRDLPPAAQERIILEEFGRSIERVIDSSSKAQVRSIATGGLISDMSASVNGTNDMPVPGLPGSGSTGHGVVGAAAASAAARDLMVHDDDDLGDEGDEDDEGMDVVDDVRGHGMVPDSPDGLDDGDLDDDVVEEATQIMTTTRRGGSGVRHLGPLSIEQVSPAQSRVTGPNRNRNTTGSNRSHQTRHPRTQVGPRSPADEDVQDSHEYEVDSRPVISISRSGRRRHPPGHLIDEMDDFVGSRHQPRHRFVSSPRSNSVGDRYSSHGHHTRRTNSHHDVDF